MRKAILPALLALLCGVACGGNGRDEAKTSPPKNSTVSDGNGPRATARLDPSLNPQRDEPASRPTVVSPIQRVDLLEYQINMPDTLHAGTVNFRVDNAGKENHAFAIEGNGVAQKSEILSRGNNGTVTVTLKPGTYTIYCPVDHHREKGMTKTIVVQ
ncbi:MAG: cupredoxin domain-containing protein [Acidobacteria bacterium]|nr:cupredoxin domain-containing protein [Acidobacteriota bacterium]MBV9070806.1 cupredoxin domain-containing protein [Acidobacteriota bacterium]MBV9475340.1 cupredoxin domain-containing protein [Acidobacteriota bacterium]